MVVIAALVAWPARARAEDPRDLFGFDKPPPEDAAIDCSDGTAVGCAMPTDDFADVSPYALRTWLPARDALRLPVSDARHDEIAHWAVGAGRDETGAFFGGATGLENRWTIEGAPVDGMRTGGVETSVPLTFLEGLFVQAGGFAARDRTSTGGTIDARLLRGGEHHVVDAYVWASYNTDPRARPIADNTYQLRRLTITNGPQVSASVVGSGPLPRIAGGRAWYAAGLAPSLSVTDFEWRAARLVDLDGDTVPDGAPGQVQLEPISTTREATRDLLVSGMARTGWERGVHEVDATLIGQVSRDTFMLANATQQAAGTDRTTFAGDAIATWRGRWKHTRARAQLAWHRSDRKTTAHDDAAARIAQLQTAYVPTMLPDDPVLAAACFDEAPPSPGDPPPSDPWPTIPNCPIPLGLFSSAGAGLLVDTVADRPTVTADVAHRRGAHVVRAGATLEDARLVSYSRYTGGEITRSLFEGHVDRLRFYRGECVEFEPGQPGGPCEYEAVQELRYRTRYTAAYVEDTFAPAPGLRVNGGLRWELMWVGPRLHFSDQFAPRIGMSWDPYGKGEWRVWASMGRSFLYLPAGIGPTLIARNRTVRDAELLGATSRRTDPGAVYSIADDVEPTRQDEVTAGIEVGVAKLVRAAAWGQGRQLSYGVETAQVDPESFAVVFGNPGRTGDTPARRSSITLAAEVLLVPSTSTQVRAGWMFNRTSGAWTGPYDPRQGVTLYEGTDWDLTSVNLQGLLPTDVGHRAFFELDRRWRSGGVELGVATRLTIASGRPRNVLADTDLGIVHLLPRGSAGRGPMISQANVRLSARVLGTDLFVDMYNVFDRDTATLVDEIYAGQSVRPIHGGTEEDLPFLKTPVGDIEVPARRASGYRLARAFQAPFAITVGARRSF